MSKFLFYISLVLFLGAAFLGFYNENRSKEVILSQEEIIQEQHDNVFAVEKELQDLKESIDSKSADQDKKNRELSDAREVQAKVENQLTQVQKQLADKEAELDQLKSDLSLKRERIQELEATVEQLSQSKETSKSKSSPAKGKGAHAEIKKEIPKNQVSSKEVGTSFQEGKVVALNTTWNFVVISIGSQDGMVVGTEISIKQNNQIIAHAKVTSVEALTSGADLIMSSLAPGTTIQIGDQVLVSDKQMGK
jgi:predicted RNase H-like nuclease (RuvC/YqgF family)